MQYYVAEGLAFLTRHVHPFIKLLMISSRQLWPRINHYVYDLVVQSIEPGLRDTLSTSYKMGSFKFEKVILGDTPIRVRGVKVYDERKTDRNEIIMDMEVRSSSILLT